MARDSSATALVGVAAIGTLLLPLNLTMVVVALPTIASDLGADIASAAWLLTACLIAVASLQPLGGRLGGRIGRRRVISGAVLALSLPGRPDESRSLPAEAVVGG